MLKAFEEHMNVKFLQWEIDPTDSVPVNTVQVNVPWYFEDEEDEENIASLRNAIESLGSYDSVTLKGYGDCVLTGVCYDEDMADGARYAFYHDGERDRKTVAMNAFHFLEAAIHNEYRECVTEEYASEFAEMNGYQFTQDGELWIDK